MHRQSLFLILVAVTVASCRTIEVISRSATEETGTVAARAALPTSGATSLADAESTAKGQTVEGVVHRGEPRYYRVSLGRGETLNLTFYVRNATERNVHSSNPAISILDLNGGVLEHRLALASETLATGGFNRTEIEYTADTAAPVVMRIDCERNCQSVHYRVVLQ